MTPQSQLEAVEVIQDHTAYPMIRKVIVSAVADNGGLHALRAPNVGAEADVLRLLDECLSADGVYHSELAALDAWFATLSDEDLENAIGGEETDMQALMARAPNVGAQTAADFINLCYEHCI